MNLVAVQEFTYADKPLKPGDRFEASAEDARILIGVEKAIDDPGVSDSRLQAMALTTETAAPIAPRTKRAYRRRDMQAER